MHGGILMPFFKRCKGTNMKGKLRVKVRNNVVYLFVSLSLALYLVGVSNESDSAYFISRVLLLVPAVSFVFGLMNISGVVCQARFVRSRIHEDEEAHICAEVVNHGSLSKTNLFLGVSISNETTGSMDSIHCWLLPSIGGEQTIHLNSLTVGKLKRGENLIEYVEVGCQSPLGAFWVIRRHICSDVCIVYPRLLCDPKFFSCYKWMSSGSFVFQDRLDYRGVREYTPSDDVKLIHWMSSAKRGELVVKLPEYRHLEPCTIMLYAPTDDDKHETMWDDEPIFEHMVRFTATLAIILHNMKWEVAVLTGLRKVIMRVSEHGNDVAVLLERLATLRRSDVQRRFPISSIMSHHGVFVLLTTCGGLKEFKFGAIPQRKHCSNKIRHAIVHFCAHGPECQTEGINADGVTYISIRGSSELLPALQECVKLLLQGRAVMSHV